MIDYTWLSNLKTGDKVVLAEERTTSSRKTVHPVKVTPKQIKVGKATFRKSDGAEVGNKTQIKWGGCRRRLIPATEEEMHAITLIQDMHRMFSKINKFDFATLSHKQLQAVEKIIDESINKEKKA